jgi:hypothetical protein
MMRTCWLAVVQMMLDQRTREGGVEPAGNSGKNPKPPASNSSSDACRKIEN